MSEWTRKVKLENLCERVGGGTPSRNMPEYWGGDIPWFTVADFSDSLAVQRAGTSREAITAFGLKQSAAKLVEPGSVICSTRVVVGKVGIAERQLVTNQDFTSFVCHESLYNEFLAYFLLSQRGTLRSKQTGATIQGIRLEGLDKLEIPLPTVATQRRTVVRIHDCFSRVEEIVQLLSLNDADCQSVEQAALRKLIREASYDTTPVHLETISNLRGGGSLPNPNADADQDGALPLIKVGDMNLAGNERVMTKARGYFVGTPPVKPWPVGTIVFPKRGGAIATNKKRILGVPALLDPNLMGVIGDPKHILSDFLFAQCQLLDLRTLSSFSTIPQFNRKDLAELPFYAPPIPQQERLIEQFHRISDSVAELRATSADSLQTTHLRTAILREAFVGRL